MRKAKSVTIRGVRYKSCKDAANALNVTPAAIYSARREKRLNTVGLSKRGRPRKDKTKEQLVAPVKYVTAGVDPKVSPIEQLKYAATRTYENIKFALGIA
jgi:hypothetical protein